ncbi:PPC domain-containing protein, partial [Vibrio cyclitrophicus]|uniref:PPC domain-containing protein n=1 Tax=Vibrio cyclitrophicus TaxID=47951 RepID=UPI0018E4CBD8
GGHYVYYMSIAGRTDFNDVKLLASLETETLPPPAQEQDDLTPIIFESGQPQIITVHQRRYAAVYVPEGVQEVRVWLTDKKATQSDTGNVDLFASRSYWPTAGKYEYTSNYTGSNEYLQIPVSEVGYLHFLLSADLEGDDVEMLVYVH